MAKLSEKQQEVFFILQFLRERGLNETRHQLESDSGLFFDMIYFGQLLTLGKWDEAEMYLSGFTKVDENRHSWKLFYEIRKQKYLEALDKQDHANAIEIMQNDLKVFSTTDKQVFEGLTNLLILDNIREHEGLSSFGNTKSTRDILCAAAKLLIEANPVFQNKLQFPFIEKAKLLTLVSRSLGIEQVPCTYKSSNSYMGAFGNYTFDICGSVGDAKKSERSRERVEVEKPSPFDIHGIANTNLDHQNVVRESNKERGKGEEPSSSGSIHY